MPTYTYAAVDVQGRQRGGTVEASDPKSAVAILTREGRFVIEIHETKEGEAHVDPPKGESRRRGRTSRSDLALFTRRMADLTTAGLPLDRVLQVLAEQTENQQLSDAVADCLVEVRGGMSVSAAIEMHPKVFPTVYVQTLKSGEASGQFAESCERMAELLENEVERRSLVISSLIYPAVLICVATFVVIFMLTFVVPRLSDVFKGFGADLPVPTKILLAITGFLTNQWYIVVGGVVAVVVGYRAWVATEAGATVRDRFFLNAPIMGPVVKKGTVSRYARVLGTLVYGGVPILEAIGLAGKSTGNKVFEHSNDKIVQDVREGVPLADAMRYAGVFPPVLTHMVAIGEETGDLPKMLGRVANSLDFEVEQGLRRMTAALEPAILLVMGGVVAFVVLSVMLPIFEAQQMVK
ncbi:MAG: type II secretion system F family protein [Fimbriimonadaceae bacterium]|nr:type II secretion system F family protein [Fimbriimonadaceae bacterium]